MATQRQVAIVTGAASGIGRAMALGLLQGGIDVAGVDRDAALLAELETEVGGGKAAGALRTVRADLADPAAFDAVVAAVLDRSGRIDILVNNAGAMSIGPMETQTLEAF
jgi:NADP-dependent 3-hydroxy acid dehydrogenase YdfG